MAAAAKVTPKTHSVLNALARHGGALTAKRLGTSSTFLYGLVQQKLLTIVGVVKPPIGRPANEYTLTAKGRKLQQKLAG